MLRIYMEIVWRVECRKTFCLPPGKLNFRMRNARIEDGERERERGRHVEILIERQTTVETYKWGVENTSISFFQRWRWKTIYKTDMWDIIVYMESAVCRTPRCSMLFLLRTCHVKVTMKIAHHIMSYTIHLLVGMLLLLYRSYSTTQLKYKKKKNSSSSPRSR